MTKILLILITIIPLYFVFRNYLRMDVAALGMAGLLGLAQALGLGMLGPAGSPKDAVKALGGFGQPVVMTLIGLFIVTRALDKSGVARWIARRLVNIGGDSPQRLIALFAGSTALLSLFMNNLAAGALLLPSAVEAARRTGMRPSKLLIPVAYGSLLGGSATYFTTANIVAGDILRLSNPALEPLHILDFTPTGGLIAVAGIIFLVLWGNKLLPNRAPSTDQIMSRLTGSELEDHYHLGERLWEAQLSPLSNLVGETLEKSGIGHNLGVEVAAVWHGRQALFSPSPEMRLAAGDVLLLIGREDRVTLLEEMGFMVGREGHYHHISPFGVALVEILLSPRSKALGQTLKELNFRQQFGFTAVALRRMERSYRTNVGDFQLQMGDSLLVIGPWDRAAALQKSSDFLVMLPNLSDQPIDRKSALLTAGIALTAVVISVLGFPVYLAMLLAALLVVLLKLVNMDDAYRSIEWSAVFLIGGMYAVSQAMVQTGLAGEMGQALGALAAPFGPLGLAAGAYVLTGLLTQLIGGQVAILVTGPAAISAALAMHTSPQAVIVAAAIGCSATFLTPFAHPVNILMLNPGHYTMDDYFHIGWRLTLISFVMLIIGMALFWRL